jgi:predicted methyltransferase
MMLRTCEGDGSGGRLRHAALQGIPDENQGENMVKIFLVTAARRTLSLAAVALLVSVSAGLAGPAARASGSAVVDYSAVLADPIRTDEDRKADERRKPRELLQFAQLRPGMNVLDVSAGGGYTTQLLALAVGPEGTVWAQGAKANSGFEKRLLAHPQSRIHPLVRPFDDPYPADAPRLDLITFVLNYHDVANTTTDRALMNRHLFAALKPGGHLIMIDHAAQAGSGLRDTNTLHRIDEAVVLAELQSAGFVLEERSPFLQNAADPRDQAFWDRKEPTDRFALRLARPAISAPTKTTP